MKIKIHKKLKSTKGLLVVPIFKEELNSLPSLYPEESKKFIKNLVKNKEFEAKKGEMAQTYLDKKNLPERLLVVGFCMRKNYSAKRVREMGGKIGKYAKSAKIKEITILLTEEKQKFTQEMLEGILMSQYEVGKYKTKKKETPYKLERFSVVVDKKVKGLGDSLEKAELINEGSDYIKDLVNAPSNKVHAKYLEKEARAIAKENNYKIRIFADKELKKMKWGALLAVNKGSAKGARCLVLQYDGAKKKSEKPVVIVGKGITFDTGGYNLKPTNYIETMQQDMAGGAVVLGLFKILKDLKVKKNVVGIVPIAENMISNKAYKPSDIIKSYSGMTIEVTNTDAEGRLILCDAVTYGTKFKPENIITIATLTGAVSVALGDRYAGLIGNDDELAGNLQKAGEEVDDLGWVLPLPCEYKKKMDSKVADVRNSDTGSSRLAGSSKGAAFLERFVDGNKWCHIDIGGTAFVDDPKNYQTKGATAHGFQMLFRYLEK